MSVLSMVPVARATDAVPYSDRNARGYIGLCDGGGTAITRGNVNDHPVVWLSVSSSPVAAGYDGFGKTATLYAYQPVPGVDPGYWTGAQITAASYYTNSAHPMVAATSDAASLSDFIKNHPLKLNGLVQLRMFVGLPGEGIHNQTYPATDIQITGNTWTVARGGNAECDAGIALTAENGGPPPTSTATASPRPPPGGTGPGGSGASQPTVSQSSSTTPSSTASAGNAGASGVSGTGQTTAPISGGTQAAGDGSGGTKGGGGILATVAILVAVLILLGGALLLVRMRRRREEEKPTL